MLTPRHSLNAHPVDHSETVSYRLIIMARMMSASAASANMTQAIAPIFTELPNPLGPPIPGVVLDFVKRTVDQAKAIVAVQRTYHRQFRPALSAMFTVYGTEIVQAGMQGGGTSTNQLLAVIYTQRVQFHDREELASAFRDIFVAEGFTAPDLPTSVQQLGESMSASALMGEAAEGRVGVVEFRAQIDITVDAEYLAYARRANNFDLAVNGFGMVAAGLSLAITLRAWDSPVRAASGFGAFALNPSTQLIAGFAEAYAASFEILKGMAGRSSTGATNAVLARVFGNSAALANSAAANGPALARAAVASKTFSASARAAGMVGVVLSGFLAYEGLRRSDSFMAAGNGLMAAGGLILLFAATGPLALVAVAVIVIGIAISFLSFNDAQRWVKDGFWGTSSNY